MPHILKSLALVAILGLAACSNADRFGDAGAGGNTPLGPGAGLGGAGDPASPAYFSQTVGDRVLFLVDQSTLTNEAQSILTQQAAWLNNNPAYTIAIEGHADERGTREYNVALSEQRANAVSTYLVSQGLLPSRITRVVGFGKERPLEICSEEACYAQNRRSVTVLNAGGV
ncbi:OmpA family protein [Anianabacter salinae]|uniref:OmpA family protein n=1 Tax=Anianabacter salinae TaxID=2851023 RepID=UPI00225E6557|nr:OmpA family protein [Anianabacter salinae]MBV0911270.1 OmpA family protein [Anianabacter salinae]